LQRTKEWQHNNCEKRNAEAYARKVDSNDVVILNSSLSYTINKPVKDWRDKTVLKVQKEQIKEVKFQYGDTTFTLTFALTAENETMLKGAEQAVHECCKSYKGTYHHLSCHFLLS
jgi:hypothetical protein